MSRVSCQINLGRAVLGVGPDGLAEKMFSPAKSPRLSGVCFFKSKPL